MNKFQQKYLIGNVVTDNMNFVLNYMKQNGLSKMEDLKTDLTESPSLIVEGAEEPSESLIQAKLDVLAGVKASKKRKK